MRILYFADIRFPLERANGIQTIETCYSLAGRGHSVQLVVRPDTQTPARDPLEYYGLTPRKGLTIERAPVSGPAFARRIGYLAFAAGRASGAGRADIVMTRDLTAASLILHLPSRAPLVYESHGYAPEVAAALPALVSTATAPSASKLARLARREAYVWRRAEGYVTITAALASALTERLGARPRLAVIPDGARIGNVVAHAVAGDRVTVGYAGHLYPWKGVDVLVEALARVPHVRGLIIGGHEKEPDLERVQALAARLGVSDRIEFTGQIAPAAVAARLQEADILTLPNPASAISSHATSPLKLFEYMAAGRAIVASNLPAIGEVLVDDVNAVLVTPGDAGALAAGISRLAADPTRRRRIASAARASVAEYSWDRRAERLEALFKVLAQ